MKLTAHNATLSRKSKETEHKKPYHTRYPTHTNWLVKTLALCTLVDRSSIMSQFGKASRLGSVKQPRQTAGLLLMFPTSHSGKKYPARSF